MQVSLHNTVKTYNLTAGKSLPEWLSERRKNKKSVAGQEGRVELLHDLEFPHCARCIFRCANGTHLFAAGDYPYRLKCFDVNDLSMKFSFNADMNILSGVCLSPDYRKFALRGEGRQITVHHTSAIVDRVRVPHLQRSLAYNPFQAELLSSGVSPEIYRINLETGAFVESYQTSSVDGVNHVEVFGRHGPTSGVVLTAGCDGAVEAWDSRAGTAVARVQVAGPGSSSDVAESCEVRHIATEEAGGLLFTCGLESGEVLLYDIRLQKPLLVKDHMNSLPIVKTYFFHGKSTATGEASFILSADTRSLKVWNKHDGSNFTTIDAPADITDFTLFKSQHNMVPPYECDDSGVVGICCDVPRVQVHFIPQLGAAPRWASFLEVMTEELEEKEATTVYDDYTFIPKEEMDALGIAAEDLAGGKVRPVMHGAFIENSLYRELRAVVDPSAFNNYIAAKAKERQTKRWSDRISRFHRTAEDQEEGNDQGGGVAAVAGGTSATALAAAKADPRFAHAFDPTTGRAAASFALDRRNPEYAKLLQTIDERRAKASARRERYESDMFAVVPDVDGADEDAEQRPGVRRTHHAAHQSGSSADVADDDEDARHHLRGVQSSGKFKPRSQQQQQQRVKTSERDGGKSAVGAGKQVTMFEVSGKNVDVFMRDDKQVHASRKKSRAEKLSLGDRLKRATATK
jgi:ribosome biogenesis protein ENP2